MTRIFHVEFNAVISIEAPMYMNDDEIKHLRKYLEIISRDMIEFMIIVIIQCEIVPARVVGE